MVAAREHPMWVLSIAGLTCSVAAMIVYVALAEGQTFPYLRNKITQFGYMRPNEVIVGERAVLWGTAVSWIATIAFALSFIVFIAQLSAPRVATSERERRLGFAGPARLVLVLFALQLAYLLAGWRIVFDRHLLVVFPTALVVASIAAEPAWRELAEKTRRVAMAVFVLLLAPFALYALAGTHDVHAFSRTAFRAGEDLLRQGVPADRIDAGYAFDGWHVYDDTKNEAGGVPEASHDGWWVWNLFPVIHSDWIVSLSATIDRARLARELTQPDRTMFLVPDLDGYEIEKTYPYRTLWPLEEKHVYVLRNTASR